MKRYLLFGWNDFLFCEEENPHGGWNDYKLSFDDLDDAIEYARVESFEHYHIVDSKDFEIVIVAR